MKIIVESDFNSMSETAKNILLGHMAKTGRVNLSITGGNTPVKVYKKMVKVVKGSSNYDNVHYYNFDEIPVEGQKEGITMSDLRRLYLTPAGIDEKNIHPLTLENYETQDRSIEEAGGLDAMLIGLGKDGHFCGNMPGTTTFNTLTHKVTVTGEESWFVPEMMEKGLEFVTMGPVSVMRVKHLVLIVNGAEKAEMVSRVLTGPIGEDRPASILQLHPNLTVILDKEAAGAL
ncbi:glucosamine-6-phosphate deaminase [Enterococcus sp. BWB1-3]|uniref:glucosamine-6-phosphate deaminase n=1 Tax=unclassified Enterococcus TaxID=2608891 RepID=UPI0019226A7E|nr:MULTISPECIES: glucosamine-6-phosphate deaminase [unclassified Enterococcus]MBL1228324.1 glucosamine-6-phosphate deaminase [Enterococcus sp. BWB1-3]MCB5951144.1 glucosamine-6-phosphate deaminase [Enterococcus sp. BWT-B8]